MGEQRSSIVVVGSINIDLVMMASRIPVPGETIQGDDFQQHFGGKGANQAVAVARLGCPVEMIGRVGTDALGEEARRSLRDVGVDVGGVESAEGPSGVASITVSRNGQNTIVVSPGANAQVTPEYLDRHEERIRRAGIVLAQLEIPMRTVKHLGELCERHGVPLILDPAPAQRLTADVMRKVAWLTPNETEAAFYARQMELEQEGMDPEKVAQCFLHKGVNAVVLKLGSRGVLMATHDERPALVPALSVKAVDTTAAGDAFNGAFAVGLMRGMSALEAARFACAASAVSVMRRGAQPSMPSLEEVDSLLREYA
jgi:ribokinase